MSAKRIAIALIGAEVGFAAVLGTMGATGHMTGVAYAEPNSGTILLSEIHNPDMFPVCAEEDCSDQPNQVGMWLDRDTGNWWLSLGESSLLVVDDSAVAR